MTQISSKRTILALVTILSHTKSVIYDQILAVFYTVSGLRAKGPTMYVSSKYIPEKCLRKDVQISYKNWHPSFK